MKVIAIAIVILIVIVIDGQVIDNSLLPLYYTVTLFYFC